ncbi:hypothetical protein JHU04_001104 [Brenneria sp. 4F2]|nr:hypothetical protein [Brenneria bubanii]
MDNIYRTKILRVIFLFLAIVSCSAVANTSENSIKPAVFIALKENSEQYDRVCKAADGGCKNGTHIWKVQGTSNTFFLTDTALLLTKVQKLQNEYIKNGQWNLATLPFDKNSSDDELLKDDVYIYPALYPLNKTKQAIALVSKWSISYSGGGREEEYADFIMLNDDGSFQLVFKNIPFSSHEMIRACFTEDDYAKNSHCHDESWSILNLKFMELGNEYYSWKFISKSYGWPAFTDKTAISSTQKTKISYPFHSSSGE